MTLFNITSDRLTLTSMLDEITVHTDCEWLEIIIESRKGGRIFREVYWPYNGSFTIWDVSYVFENFMRSTGAVVLDDVTIKAYHRGALQAIASLNVIYCEALSESGSSDFERNFLTTSASRRVAPDSMVFLFAYGDDVTHYSISYQYRIAGDEYTIFSDEITDLSPEEYDNLKSIRFHQNKIQFDARNKNPNVSYWWQIEVVGFVVTCGRRSARFVVDKSLNDGITFYFRNCFNCPDFITLKAVTKSKTEVSRSLAKFGARAVFYDQVNEKNYDVETAPLLTSEAEFIDQLISSTEVYKIIPQDDDNFIAQLILITDSTCEISDDDNLDTIKYTWRYADNRLHKSIQADSLLRIFTYQFNQSFT